MSDRRRQRGCHPTDRRDFAENQLVTLREANAELCWLLDRGYPQDAAATLVGNRHALRVRQRSALQRAAASDRDCARRRQRQLRPASLAGEALVVDGYNVLLTVEVALGGGVVIGCRDGTARDLAAMSGHYRKVEQTLPALLAIGDWLQGSPPSRVDWLLDRPVSNSGRLKRQIESAAADHGWSWAVHLEGAVDRQLIESPNPVATADSGVLDRCGPWVNLACEVVRRLGGVWWVELGASENARRVPTERVEGNEQPGRSLLERDPDHRGRKRRV